MFLSILYMFCSACQYTRTFLGFQGFHTCLHKYPTPSVFSRYNFGNSYIEPVLIDLNQLSTFRHCSFIPLFFPKLARIFQVAWGSHFQLSWGLDSKFQINIAVFSCCLNAWGHCLARKQISLLFKPVSGFLCILRHSFYPIYSQAWACCREASQQEDAATIIHDLFLHGQAFLRTSWHKISLLYLS